MSILPDHIKTLFSNTQCGEDYVSIPTKAAREQTKRYSISKYIRPINEHLEDTIYCNDGYYGVVIEAVPHIRMGTKTAEAIREILNKLSQETFFQIILWGSKNIENMIDQWEHEHSSDNEAVDEAIKQLASFYRNKTNEKISRSMETTIKNHRLFFSFKSKNQNELIDLKEHVLNILSTNSFNPTILDLKALKPIYWELFNPKHSFKEIPKYDHRREFGPQCVSSENIVKINDEDIFIGRKNSKRKLVGKSWIALSPSSLPDYAHISDFGKKLGDYISQACNTNQFNDSFLISFNVNKLNKSEIIKIRNRTSSLTKQRGKKTDTKLKDKQAESNSIIKRLNDFEPLYNFDISVLVSGDSYDKAKKNVATVNSFWVTGGETSSIKLGECNGVHLNVFLASLPLGLNKDYFTDIQGNPYKLFSDQISQFAPVEADYKGNYPNNFFISKRGQLAGFDFFNTSASKNGWIVAASGKGKSMLLNYMVLNSYTRGDRIFITDIGGSYEPICEELGGQYIEVDLDNPISFNPFTDLDTDKDGNLLLRDLNYFSDFIYSLGSSKLKSKAQELQNIIKPEIQRVIKELFQNKPKFEISDIRDEIAKSEDPRYKDFAIAMTPFCRGELFGDFFSGKCEINLKNQLAVLELGKVEQVDEIRDACIFIWEYHKSQAVYHQEKDADHGGRRILVIIDEVHKFLGKNEMMDDAIEQAYRRFRKHNASIWIATQSFEDINDSKGLTRAGQVIISNSPWKIFLAQEEPSLNLLLHSKTFEFNHTEEELIKKVDTIKGQYSELFLITPEQQKIPYRLVLNKYFYYLTTTDQDDKAKVYQVMKSENLSKKDAINRLIEYEDAA